MIMIHVAVSKYVCARNLRVTVVSCNWHVRSFLTALGLAGKANVRNMCDAPPVYCLLCSWCLLIQPVLVSCNMLPIWQHPDSTVHHASDSYLTCLDQNADLWQLTFPFLLSLPFVSALQGHTDCVWVSVLSGLGFYCIHDVCLVWAQLHCQIAITIVYCTPSASVPDKISKPIVRLSTFTRSSILQPPDFKHQELCSGVSCLKQPMNNEEAIYTLRMEINI